ncbi:MAG TPA: GNAT family N-acetyltransferase [Thermoanaerobaculia bacterium]
MSLEIRNDEKNRKFYADVEGHEAVIEYVRMGDAYNLLHTFVPEELRGRHVGEELVRGTLDQIKAQGATFLPSCPFVQAFVKRHPEYQEAVASHTSGS